MTIFYCIEAIIYIKYNLKNIILGAAFEYSWIQLSWAKLTVVYFALYQESALFASTSRVTKI